ncbi:MAG: TraR/DksA family transcriptional regulator [Phycisphaerales bacterium]
MAKGTKTKKPPAKPASKGAAKPSSAKGKAKKPLPTPKAAPSKPAASAKGSASKPAAKKAVKSIAPGAMPAVAGGGLLGQKMKPKGITIVSQKPMRKPPKPKKILVMPNLGQPLLKPGHKWKPLIASGPKAPVQVSLNHGHGPNHTLKTHLGKRDLDYYKQVLLRKRAELVGDVSHLEGQALKDASGGALSHTPQHMAEQGSDNFDQGLSLDIAQVDRNLIREIDEAVMRIDKGSYGVCEITHKPISKDRLEELPWTRFSIEGARERERRQYLPVAPKS